MLLCVVYSYFRPLGSALAAFVSGRRSLSAVEMRAKIQKLVTPKPAFPGKSSLNQITEFNFIVCLVLTVYFLCSSLLQTSSSLSTI